MLIDSPRHGITRNPWDPDFTLGGFSGGAAVAVAPGMGPSAVTTDGAGSSRIPASCCGVLGLKATLGRIPNEDGADLFGAFSYIGAVTRTTWDLVMMLNAMSGAEPGYPWARSPSADRYRITITTTIFLASWRTSSGGLQPVRPRNSLNRLTLHKSKFLFRGAPPLLASRRRTEVPDAVGNLLEF